MSLFDSIESLTADHKTTVHTADGLEFHTKPALLTQLREAVFGGMESTGGSSLKSKLPISEASLDLYQLIDHQVSEAWSQANGGRVPGAGKPEQLLTEWGSSVDSEKRVVVTVPEQRRREDDTMFVVRVRSEYTAETLAARWATQIEDHLNPLGKGEITSACFVCEERYVYRRKDGENVRTSALVFVRDDVGETLRAECLHCGAQWPKDQFEFLRHSLGIEDKTITDEPKKRASVEWSGSVECFEGHHQACTSIRCKCDHHLVSEASGRIGA